MSIERVSDYTERKIRKEMERLKDSSIEEICITLRDCGDAIDEDSTSEQHIKTHALLRMLKQRAGEVPEYIVIRMFTNESCCGNHIATHALYEYMDEHNITL